MSSTNTFKSLMPIYKQIYNKKKKKIEKKEKKFNKIFKKDRKN
jgi:DNA-binding transcriptional regulator YhcF (GntR family)